MRMGRFASLLAVGVIVGMTLTGCIDIVQYISGDSNDIYVYTRVTLQKSAFEMANSFSDEPQDLEKMFAEEFPLDEQSVRENSPEWLELEFEPVNTAHEYGFAMNYHAPREEFGRIPDGEAELVPRFVRNGIVIPLSEGGATGGEQDQFTQAFLGGAKYHLMISKRLVCNVAAARLVTDEAIHEIAVTSFPDIWMLEFPVSLWLGTSGVPQIEIDFR
jgi:hypothetical protein